MLFGLAIGLSVAFAVYVSNGKPSATNQHTDSAPAVAKSTPKDSQEKAATTEKAPAKKSRFAFYDMLPNFEVVIPDQERDVKVESAPESQESVVTPGIYVLQAGSFGAWADADRRRAELALHGIESKIQKVTIDDKTYHRVRIGPISNLDQLNLMRSRLHAAHIEAIRIRLGDSQ